MLGEEGSLSLRVWQSLPHERVGELATAGIRSGFGNSMLRLGYLKAFMDGTLGSQTARMLDGSGVEITSREQLEEIVRAARRAGFPVAVHAIGDLANREALDAFEATRGDWDPRGLRQRIEHAQLLAPEDVARFASLGVTASVQFSHAPSDRDVAERFWAGKLDGAYAFRSLWDSGAVVVNGSDAPIEELDPLAGIVAGVLRTLDERPSWRPEQALTVEQALHATTVTPAWLARDERRRGKLVPGHYADLVVLNRDPLDCPPEELARARGGRDDAGRPLAAQPAALGLAPAARHRTRACKCSPRYKAAALCPLRACPCRRRYRSANARKSSCAAAMPFGRYSTSIRSFGEWMFESGSEKPVSTVGIPFFASAGTIGSVPPDRISSGRTPSARSNASRPSWIALDDWSTRPGSLCAQSSTSSSAPAGVASRSSRSNSGAISSGSWPGASRIDTFATASTGRTVFWRSGDPPAIPFTSTAGSAQVRK